MEIYYTTGLPDGIQAPFNIYKINYLRMKKTL